MVTIPVNASIPYTVLLDTTDDWILDHLTTYPRVWVVTDETVHTLHGASFRRMLASVVDQITWSIVRPGDDTKSLHTLETLVREGLESGCDRQTLIIAFGGGMIGDLAGFLASTYMRGVPYIQVPTTILAHDSAIGGKVAVNHPLAKNAIGSFYQPRGVFYNVSRLETLTSRDRVSGLGELIKHAYLSRYVLDESFEDDLFQALTRPLDWEHWLARGIEVKRHIVEEDETEQGKRAWLNFGHTFGHALESVEAYRLRHGEAILYGMVYAFIVGGDTKRAERLMSWMKAENVPTVRWQSFESYVAHMKRDKKNKGDAIRFVLLDEDVRIDEIPMARLVAAFDLLKGWM